MTTTAQAAAALEAAQEAYIATVQPCCDAEAKARRNKRSIPARTAYAEAAEKMDRALAAVDKARAELEAAQRADRREAMGARIAARPAQIALF